jgi:hypothetical protein
VRPRRVVVGAAALVFVAAANVLPMQVASAQAPSSTVVLPVNNATVSGTSQVFDAVTSSGATQVQYEITGGTLSDSVIATGVLWIFGWLAEWNTTSVPNGTYALQSVTSYPGGVTATSSAVTVSVDNAPPSTTVLIPSSGATESSANGAVFDASASPGVTQVSFYITGDCGGTTLPATLTIYGWIAVGGATSGGTPVDFNCYVESDASYSGGVSGTSSDVPFTYIEYVTRP